MREIPLSNGKTALVDDDNFDRLMSVKWYAENRNGRWYARRRFLINGKRLSVWMHKLIVETPSGMMIDHRDGNGLNNQRNNLRIATNKQNQQNRPKCLSAGSSRFKGVSQKRNGKWRAQIGVDGKSVWLGSFSNEEDAARVYNDAALKYNGEFVRLNDV